ncbi:hypothetical protein [Spiroplasma sp. SV19]|uniref:hypothetical protein n=1 Tax=Spiroplasma sp. SV19 TaxID=2570468 RepID=UPI0024B6CA7D|nr:hypothetical protein [Spiroplasma sp. SV19]WHQ37070.1 hypothetical protein E7Y35_04130 [Spiroplasma sp. SV19]
MTEQNTTPKKQEYDNFLIKKERIIKAIAPALVTLPDGTTKETKAKYLIRLSEKETFFYPQNSVFPKALANDGEHLLKETSTLEEADYAQISYPKNSKDWDKVKISTFEGNDEQGKAIYKERDCALTGLKTHFKEETALIWDEMRKAKEEFLAKQDVSNSR